MIENRKNNKLIEILDSLNYFEVSKVEALNLTLKNNEGIVELYQKMNIKKVIRKKLAI